MLISDAMYGFVTFDFYSDAFNCKDFYIFYQLIIMIFHQYVIYVLIYDYLKFRKDPSITSQEIANYISVALALALSVVLGGYTVFSLSAIPSFRDHFFKGFAL